MSVVAGNLAGPADAVRSRISWGAIIAGAAVALAIYSLLAMLGLAIGISVSDEVDQDNLGTGAGIWAFISLLIALFAGGWVTTQCTSGESRTEAILYGIVLWAATMVILLWLAASGLRLGMSTAMTGQSIMGNQATLSQDAQNLTPEEQQQMMRQVRERSQSAAWWTFAGTLVSMLAAIGGALVGPYEFTIRREYRSHLSGERRGDYPRTDYPRSDYPRSDIGRTDVPRSDIPPGV